MKVQRSRVVRRKSAGTPPGQRSSLATTIRRARPKFWARAMCRVRAHRRDYILADWLWLKNNEVANAHSLGDAVEHSAGANGGIVAWLRSPRRARRKFVRQLDEWGITERLSGLPDSKK